MKVKLLKDELKQLSLGDLEARVEELRRELLTLRLQAATSSIKSLPSKKRGLRRAIACGMTYGHQKKAAKESSVH